LSRTKPHDEFLELCAASTSGQLTAAEQKKLDEHLAVCLSCRDALKQYQAVIEQVIPTLAPEEVSAKIDPGPGWSQDRSEQLLFERIAREGKRERQKASEDARPEILSSHALPHPFQFSSRALWHRLWGLYAAAILLFVALGLVAYQIGTRRAVNTTSAPPAINGLDRISLEEQLSDASHERELVRARLEQRDRSIADLRRQLEQQAAEINRFKTLQAKSEGDLASEKSVSSDSEKQRAELADKLVTAQSNAQSLQQKLDSLTTQSSRDTAQAAALQASVNDLTHLLQERQTTIDQQQELLARDRDIRELMGARDLYIAEVHDVAGTGTTSKPYGRVFYTKGKSLIFYAYDLDQQKAARNTSTFQVWGRRGSDWQQAIPLGIFYEDNASKRRWVMKLHDPNVLGQIDAVFVTIEPNGGSRKPSEKPLLFAYLKVEPNHP
jgi:Anti-sigma-K factor rskA, C-terminal